MSGGEEDEKELELKDLIVQTLESNGLLSKIKAQLRASVFQALDESDKENSKNANFSNTKVRKLLATNEGREAVSLVRDFLEVCNLDFTISVFDPELNSNILMDKKERLIKNLNIDENELNNDNPMLVEFLKQYKQNSSSQNKNNKNNNQDSIIPEHIIDTIKTRFDKFDSNKKGHLDKDKTKTLFLGLFSSFNKNMIERFVLDEIETNEFKNGVNFDEIVKIYNKFFHMCTSVASHNNVNSNNEYTNDHQQNNKFGFITSRNTASKSNNLDQLMKTNNSINDSLSSSSSSSISSNSAFKRDEKAAKNSDSKLNTIKPANNNMDQTKQKNKNSYLDDQIEDFNDVEVLKPTKASSSTTNLKSTNPFDNDDLFTAVPPPPPSSSTTKTNKSTVSELPPLTNSNFQNKFFSTVASKELDKKLDTDDNYDDDFTNGTTPRTPKFERKSSKNRSAIGSDEEIEDNISYVEENSKFDEVTIDRSISTIQGNNDADYIEDVSI